MQHVPTSQRNLRRVRRGRRDWRALPPHAAAGPLNAGGCEGIDGSAGSRDQPAPEELSKHDEAVDCSAPRRARPATRRYVCRAAGPRSYSPSHVPGTARARPRWEESELDRQVNLAAIDRELHDAHDCRDDTFEVRSLHRYPTLMWRADAQVNVGASRPTGRRGRARASRPSIPLDPGPSPPPPGTSLAPDTNPSVLEMACFFYDCRSRLPPHSVLNVSRRCLPRSGIGD